MTRTTNFFRGPELHSIAEGFDFVIHKLCKSARNKIAGNPKILRSNFWYFFLISSDGEICFLIFDCAPRNVVFGFSSGDDGVYVDDENRRRCRRHRGRDHNRGHRRPRPRPLLCLDLVVSIILVIVMVSVVIVVAFLVVLRWREDACSDEVFFQAPFRRLPLLTSETVFCIVV